jgi:hypothetical protein
MGAVPPIAVMVTLPSHGMLAEQDTSVFTMFSPVIVDELLITILVSDWQPLPSVMWAM